MLINSGQLTQYPEEKMNVSMRSLALFFGTKSKSFYDDQTPV